MIVNNNDSISSVKLVSYTTPDKEFFEDTDIKTLEQLIGFVGRVSNPKNQGNTETMDKLISYLIRHAHWSPFEMANVTLEIQTPRDIARQILRHRSFSFQEFSQRYADPTKMPFAIRECRMQDQANRQNSISSEDTELKKEWEFRQGELLSLVDETYQWALEKGIAKEVARVVLPEGLTMSRMYMNGTIRSWIHYISIRTGPETQKEHQEIALKCCEEIAKVFPKIFNFKR